MHCLRCCCLGAWWKPEYWWNSRLTRFGGGLALMSDFSQLTETLTLGQRRRSRMCLQTLPVLNGVNTEFWSLSFPPLLCTVSNNTNSWFRPLPANGLILPLCYLTQTQRLEESMQHFHNVIDWVLGRDTVCKYMHVCINSVCVPFSSRSRVSRHEVRVANLRLRCTSNTLHHAIPSYQNYCKN